MDIRVALLTGSVLSAFTLGSSENIFQYDGCL
jgi:hypothetical protein